MHKQVFFFQQKNATVWVVPLYITIKSGTGTLNVRTVKKRERKFARSSRNGSVILYRLMVCSQKDFSTTFSKNHHLRLSGARKKTHSIIINYIQKGGERIYSIESIEQNKKSSLFLEEYYKQKNRCLQLSILNFLFLLVFIIYFYLLLCLFD